MFNLKKVLKNLKNMLQLIIEIELGGCYGWWF